MIQQKNHLNNLPNDIQALKDYIFQLEEIIAQAPGHLFWRHRDGHYLGCNNEMAESLGLESRLDVINTQPIDNLDPSLPDSIRQEMVENFDAVDQEVINQRQHKILEEILELTDGTQRTFISKKKPLYDADGEVIGLIGTSVDISYQKELERRLIEANEHKSRFILDISSLFREPLNYILGSAQVLQKSQLSLKQQECVDTILHGAEKIIPLLTRFHDYLDLEDNDLNKPVSTFMLHDFMDRMAETYRVKATQKSLSFTFEYDSDLPEWVLAGSYFLSQILNNLLTNAVRYTSHGFVGLAVKKSQQLEGNEFILELKVKDSGRGMRKQVKQQIFNFFENRGQQREDSFTTGGLNLSISAKMIHMLGGSITVESALSEGSEFTIKLPIEATEPQRKLDPDYYKGYLLDEKEPILTRNKDSQINILIVEDDPFAQRTLKVMLETVYNCQVVQAFDYQSAEKLKNEDFNLVFTSMNLPDGTGLDVVKAFSENEGKATPIVAVTSYTSEEEKETMGFAGITDIIEKPVGFDALLKVVDYNVFYEHDTD